ncbi:MAG: hypothetical protein M0P23_03315, partial [Bacteroidales bacterium]|nr:hypothetical protein [Bacteroidales bacterium]
MDGVHYNDIQIEQWGSDAVGVALSHTDTLQRFFKENDKTPLWDGQVIIYKNQKWNKKNLLGKVSVQLKGKLAPKKDFSKKEISYSVKIVDLVKYQKNFGTIFFVTLINKVNITEKIIYYETLTPKKIRRYIKGKEQQLSCTIRLKQFPNDKFSIHSIFHNFYIESSFGDIPPINLDELRFKKGVANITASTTRFLPQGKKISPIDLLLNNELFWTAKFADHPIPIPIELGTGAELSIISRDGLPSIIVKDIKYDDYLSIIHRKGSTIYKFGKSTTIEKHTNSEDFTLRYTPSDFLSDRIKDMNFIINLIETCKIQIEGKPELCLGELRSNNPFNIDTAKDEYDYYKSISEFWRSLKVNVDFNIGNIDFNSSLNELHLLMESMNGKIPVHINIDEKSSCFLLRKEISNLKILLLLKVEDKQKSLYKIYNYFDHKGNLKFTRDEIEHISSKFSVLNADDYIELSNIDFSDMLQSYKEVLLLNNRIYDLANYDLLSLLTAYDKHKDPPAIMLKTAKDIAAWILEEGGDIVPVEFRIINFLQTVKRERELTLEENSKLYKITEDSDNTMSKLGANLLLENFKVAQLQFNQLSEDESKHP